MELIVRLSALEHCYLQNLLELEAANLEADISNSSPGSTLHEVSQAQLARTLDLLQKLDRAAP